MIAGYLIHGGQGKGDAYTYIMDGQGVVLHAANDFMSANIRIAGTSIRGLPVWPCDLNLRYGRIPLSLFNLALNAFLADTETERYLAITWEDGYHLWQPEQTITGSSVEYQTMDNVVLEIHSHGKMKPFFSAQDNKDEQGFRIYAVAGRLNDEPRIRLRVGIYGYFREILFQEVFEVFDGPCPIDNFME